MVDIIELMKLAVQSRASDLHVSVGSQPIIRLHGDLQRIGEESLTSQDTEDMVKMLINDQQWEHLNERGELDFSYSLPGISRFRVNAYRQRGNFSLAIRMIPTQVPAFETLGLPEVVRSFADKHMGLVLVTGPTGSGKSTSLASLIAYINQTKKRHIITLEDPIEYLHRHGQSVIDQREIGFDTQSFANGLRAALRQDPDVILVGEMRDLETVTTAITAAETGHLVFATLHTPDAPQSVDRIIDVFPPNQQQQVRVQLAGVLVGVVSQRLLQTADGNGRVATIEILVNTPAVANLIRSAKIHQLRSTMQTGKGVGMQTMEMSLRELLAKRKISDAVFNQVISEWSGVNSLA